MSLLSLAGMAARFPAVAANPAGALLFSKNFWKAVAILVIGFAVYSGMKYVYDAHMELKDQVVAEHAANVIMKNDLYEKQTAINNLTESFKAQKEAIDRLSWRQNQNRDALDKLRQGFSERDIGVAATRDPVTVQNEINQAAKDRTRCYQLATGAKQKEGEVNKVCPQLLKSSQ